MYRVEYFTSVKKPCGWRQEVVYAKAQKLSEKTCVIVDAKILKSESISQRQEFDTDFWAENEIGKKKRISTLLVCEEIKEG